MTNPINRVTVRQPRPCYASDTWKVAEPVGYPYIYLLAAEALEGFAWRVSQAGAIFSSRGMVVQAQLLSRNPSREWKPRLHWRSATALRLGYGLANYKA